MPDLEGKGKAELFDMNVRRRETFVDKIWRYRGVLMVVSVPVLLITAVVMIMPRPRGTLEAAATSEPTVFATGAKSTTTATGQYQYCVVLDAGSTGSRVHTFKFERKAGNLVLLNDDFHQLKPGLSSYADTPVKAAESLKPLLENAIAFVPVDQQKTTPILLRATAGLRLLPGSKAEDILTEVKKFLKKYPFNLKDDGVSILDGQNEGAYAWLTLNYLLNKLGGDVGNTVAAIDLGGGSVQEAFAVSEGDAAKAQKGYVVPLTTGGHTYYVYVHSYLGYGLMAARAKIADAGKDAKSSCFAAGFTFTYNYASKDYPIKSEQEGTFQDCKSTAFKALDHGSECGATKTECSFSGGWRGKGPDVGRPYFVSSYFWDRAMEAGIITDKKALQFTMSPQDFSAAAGKVCGQSSENVTKTYTDVASEHAHFFCLDLSYCYTLLTEGFDLPKDTKVTLVKQVEYNGQNIEAAWALGAALTAMS